MGLFAHPPCARALPLQRNRMSVEKITRRLGLGGSGGPAWLQNLQSPGVLAAGCCWIGTFRGNHGPHVDNNHVF